jgi:hypothetical protein
VRDPRPWPFLAVFVLACAARAEAPVPDPGPRADDLLRAGAAEEAAVLYAAAIERDASDVAAMAGRVRALLALQQWREALGEAERYRERHPADGGLRAALGEALFRAGELERIDPLLDGAADPTPRALLVLGRLREAQGRAGEAVELMGRAAAAAPDDRDVLYWAAGSTPTRAEAVGLLRRYLELADGDDPDRIEAAKGTIAVFEALEERPIWVAAERPRRVEIPLRRIWDEHTGTVQGFVIQARLGGRGKPVPLLLDSGSPGLFVIRRIAGKRGFEPLADRTTFGGGGAQRHTTTRGFFSVVEFDGLRFSTALATTSRQELDPVGRFHGVVGLSVFQGYRVTLDTKNERLLLEPPAAAVSGTPYWTVEGQMLARAELNGEPAGLFLFDTGSTRTVVGAGTAARIAGARPGRPATIHGFGGILEGARELHGVRVDFCGSSSSGTLNAVDLSVRSRLAAVEIGGFVGLDMLASSRIVVDTVARRIDLVRVP